MAQKIITQNINDDTHDKIFEESLAKLEASKWQS
jgi:F-type H+-transporting ATPase subunit b